MTEMTTLFVTDRHKATFRIQVPTQLATFPLDEEAADESLLETLEPDVRAEVVSAKIRCLKEANR